MIVFERAVETLSEQPAGAFHMVVVAGFNPEVLGISLHPEEVEGFATEASGRNVALSNLIVCDSVGVPYSALTISGGASPSNGEIDSLISLLSFVGGCTVYLAAVAEYDVDCTEISRRLFRHASCHAAARPPFRLQYPRDGIRYFPSQFGDLLDAMIGYRRSPALELPAAVSHLLAEAPHLDVEIRDLALALDTLIESDYFAPGNLEPIIQADAYASASAALLEMLAVKLSARALERAKSIIGGLNSDSYSARRREFWKRVGFDPTQPEKAAYGHRHPMSHSGFIHIPESRFDEKWQALIRDAAILRTLVNRCILALLGWEYPAMDYLTFSDAPMPTRPTRVP